MRKTVPNQYVVLPCGSVEVHCINGNKFMIDVSDIEMIKKYQWHVNNRGYAVSGSVKPYLRLHRLLLGVTDSNTVVDHISGNKLDNRRSNLRVCKCHENIRNQRKLDRNTSGYKGVSFWKGKGKYIAEIVYHDEKHERHRKILGSFESPIDAALAYDRAAILLHGIFARTNQMLGLITEVQNENSKAL